MGYFDSLAGWQEEMPYDKLEDMLISLGLADTKKDVIDILDTLDTRDVNFFDGLDFEEYLEIIRKCTRPDILPVFKAMMEGNLGNQNLSFETVLSQYRRKLFLTFLTERDKKREELQGSTKGSSKGNMKGSPRKGSSPMKASPKAKDSKASPKEQGPSDPSKKGEQVLGSFADLQKFRYDEAEESGERNHGFLPFEAGGAIPTGGLGMVWRTVVNEQGLASSRPSSADGMSSSKHREPPMSPRAVVNSVLKVKLSSKKRGRTVIVRESEAIR